MNDKRRQLLNRAVISLGEAERIISRALDEEQDALDATPENLENSERYERLEYNVGKLEEALEDIAEASDCLREATE